MLPDGLAVMKAWGFTYKSNIVWHKVRKDGGSDGRGVGFYFRNVTELILFGVKGKNALAMWRRGGRQVNLLATRKREHSRKPDEQYDIIEACSPGPFVELFGRGARKGWITWGVSGGRLQADMEDVCQSLAGGVVGGWIARPVRYAFNCRSKGAERLLGPSV